MSYDQALSAFRNEVNRKHTQELNQNTRQRCVAKTGSYQGLFNNRGGGCGGRYSNDNRCGRGRGRTSVVEVKTDNGRQIEVIRMPDSLQEMTAEPLRFTLRASSALRSGRTYLA